jgi:hypothetical protein
MSSVRNTSPSLQRSRSALDHRGIDIAARLLVAGIWLERQIGNAPKILTLRPQSQERPDRPQRCPASVSWLLIDISETSDEKLGNHSGR